MFRSHKHSSVTQTYQESLVVTEHVVVAEEDDNGNVVNVVKPVFRDILNADEDVDLPSSEEYKIGRQLEAGLPLKEIPVGNLLNPTDPLDVENYASEQALTSIREVEMLNEEKPLNVEQPNNVENEN